MVSPTPQHSICKKAQSTLSRQFRLPLGSGPAVDFPHGDSITLSRSEFGRLLQVLSWKKMEEFKDPGNILGDLPSYRLPHPCLFVPGYNSKPEGYSPVLQKLTADGLNGGAPCFVRVNDNTFHRDWECREAFDDLRPDARVFVARFDSPLDPPSVTAQCSPQTLATLGRPPRATDTPLGRTIEAVKHAAHDGVIHVQGTSMGGLAVRCYLDHEDAWIDNLVLLAVPHQGTRIADWALKGLSRYPVLQQVAWMSGITEEHRPALTCLASKKNAWLTDLNQRLSQQMGRAGKITSIVCGMYPTLSNRDGQFTEGDGLVDLKSATAAPGNVVMVTDRQHYMHGHLNRNRHVYTAMAEAFGWEKAPAATGPADTSEPKVAASGPIG